MLRPGVVIASFLVLATAAPAAAQDPDVILDPDSPSAKEYAIPFESARRQAAGGDRVAAGGETRPSSGPLFGVGIGIRAPRDWAPRRESRPDHRDRGTQRTAPAPSPSQSDRSGQSGRARVSAGPPDGGIGSAAALGTAGAGALVLAAATARLVRRRRRGL